MTKLMRRYAMSSVSWVLIARLRMTSVLGFKPVRTGFAWRKVEYRNLAKLSMNDATYEKIFTQVHTRGAYCEVANDFSAWIRAIQKATILELRPEDPWTNNEDLIQVRRMRAQDLESQVVLPESEHEYDDTLDVIKLPLPIPIEKLSDAPQFLFIRPDEYALFKCFGQQDWCILTGNPGISKSWFQWKFILFCYRLDLFDKFSPFKEKLLGDLEEDDLCLEGLKTEDQTFTEKEQMERNVPAKSFIPQLIVRTEAGCKSLFFFVGRNDDVLLVGHRPNQLDEITDENSTILWEPELSKTPVYYSRIKAHIIVTVSHNEALFHQFGKRAKIFYIPCPSELQILLMGQIYRMFSNDVEYHLTDAEIHRRVKKFGP